MAHYLLMPLVGATLAVGFAGCGGGGDTTVHSHELEGQIANEVHQRTGVTVSVVCPEPITQTTPGTTFVCKATTPQGLPFTVTMKNGEGASSSIVKITKG